MHKTASGRQRTAVGGRRSEIGRMEEEVSWPLSRKRCNYRYPSYPWSRILRAVTEVI